MRLAALVRGLLVSLAATSCVALGCTKFSESAADDVETPEAGGTDAGTGDAGDTTDPDAAALPPVVLDTFSRTVGSGFGSAELGGAWTTSGATSVANGAGQLPAQPGKGPAANIRVASENVDVQAVVSFDDVGDADGGTGNGSYLSVTSRDSGKGSYLTQFAIQNGRVKISPLARVPPAPDVALGQDLTMVVVKPNEQLRLRVQVTGGLPTRLRAKAWKASEPEPAEWQSSVVDNSPALQQAGRVGIHHYLSASAKHDVTAALDEIVIRPLP